MNINYVAIPLQVLNAPAYAELQWGDKQLLIDLYVLFSDCDSFTVDLDKPLNYRQPPCAAMNVRLVRLLRSGLLEVSGKMLKKRGRVQRVFAFKHGAAGAYESENAGPEAHACAVAAPVDRAQLHG